MRLLSTSLLLLAAYCLLAPALLAQSFSTQECNRYAENTATVLVTGETEVTLTDDEPLQQGDQIALITGDQQCAGVRTWDGSNMAIAVSELWSDSLGTTPGYEVGEKLRFRVWDASQDSVVTVAATFDACRICETEKSYANDGVYLLSSLTAEPADQNVAERVSLGSNYPNPVTRQTAIPFRLPEAAFVTVDIFNALGQKITTLASREMAAGHHEVYWNASSAASGMYIYQLQTEGAIKSRTLLVVK